MRYLFIGNRPNVFKKMMRMNCNIIGVYVVADSYLEEHLQNIGHDYKRIMSKKQLCMEIEQIEFDCLVSNGCPYILPVSKLKKNGQKFINIHPSLLPDLKGKHPINGAILFDRMHGVTCHHMDEGIDTGQVIDNIQFPVTDDLDIGLVYQLSFFLEGEVFERALALDFRTRVLTNVEQEDSIYYSRSEGDLEITSKDSLDVILRKIWAFGIPSLCARFTKERKSYKILSARVVNNPLLEKLFFLVDEDEILFSYGSKVLVKRTDKYIEFTMAESVELVAGNRFFGF